MTRAALAMGLLCICVGSACSSADQTAERKAVADANAKVNAYCDKRAELLRSFKALPDGGDDAGSRISP